MKNICLKIFIIDKILPVKYFLAKNVIFEKFPLKASASSESKKN